MAVTSGDAMAMVQDDGFTVATHEVGEDNNAVGRGQYSLAIGCGDIDAAVECALTIERVSPLAKRPRNRAFHGPEARRRVRPQPVRGSDIAGQAESDAGGCCAAQSSVFEGVEAIEGGVDLRILNGVCRRGQNRVGLEAVE